MGNMFGRIDPIATNQLVLLHHQRSAALAEIDSIEESNADEDRGASDESEERAA